MLSSVSSSQPSLMDTAIGAARSAASSNAQAMVSTSSTSNASALASLGSNYNQFLTMLTTQLQNQDPSSPMSTDSFTSELAQFAGVEQQVQTNSNLSSLISLTQADALTQGMNLVGRTVSVSGSALPLQNGSASLSFTAPAAGDVAIAISDANGNVVRTEETSANGGANIWAWDGRSDSGAQLPDGQYAVAIEQSGIGGASTSLSPVVSGAVTGVEARGSSVNLRLGDVSTEFGDLVGT